MLGVQSLATSATEELELNNSKDLLMNPTQSVILVIEDDAAIRRGIVDALEFTGFRVLESADGREGLKLATEQNYDLLLLDLALPNVSGFEILETLKDKRPNQPVIILTAKGEEQDRLRGLRGCLLYTSPSPRDLSTSRMPSSA